MAHLSGGSGRGSGGGVHIAADEGLAQDGEQAALGLLSASGADIDEAVDIGRGGGG